MSKPSVNQPYISARSARAAVCFPWVCHKRLRLMAARSSNAFAPCWRAIASACWKHPAASAVPWPAPTRHAGRTRALGRLPLPPLVQPKVMLAAQGAQALCHSPCRIALPRNCRSATALARAVLSENGCARISACWMARSAWCQACASHPVSHSLQPDMASVATSGSRPNATTNARCASRSYSRKACVWCAAARALRRVSGVVCPRCWHYNAF